MQSYLCNIGCEHCNPGGCCQVTGPEKLMQPREPKRPRGEGVTPEQMDRIVRAVEEAVEQGVAGAIENAAGRLLGMFLEAMGHVRDRLGGGE